MFVEVNGQLLQAVSFGSGERTLVAHGGWVGNWELWQQPFELLSPTWRCLSYDHRGSGESVTDPATLTPDALVEDLFAVLDRHEVDRCVLAGESLGVVVVLEAARRQPERFEGLVLVDGGPGIVGDLVQHLIDGSRADFPATVAAFVDQCLPEGAPEHLRKWGRDLLLRAEPEAAARLFECYLDPPAPFVALEEVTVPSLVIHGRDDRIVPFGIGEWMAAELPDATLVPLDDAGHVPTVTRPQDVVAAIVDRFG